MSDPVRGSSRPTEFVERLQKLKFRERGVTEVERLLPQ
jgi:hypothetical protein